MNKKLLVPLLILAVVIGAIIMRKPASDAPVAVPPPVVEEQPSPAPEPTTTPPADGTTAEPILPGALPPGVPMPQPPPSAPGDRFARPALDKSPDPELEIARNDAENIGLMLRDFRTVQGENPTGSNAEIMKAVMGGNKKGAQLGPPTGMALNQEGELVDRWGTPVFFHQLSGNEMEIRSAGPDRKLYTGDDITTK
jgi:hypothetical protein